MRRGERGEDGRALLEKFMHIFDIMIKHERTGTVKK